MGFRNPVTTATALDTRAGAGGVQIGNDGSATWYDGTGGTGSIAATSSGGGSVAGSAFTMTGPNAGVTIPTVKLFLRDNPAGGYFSVFGVQADEVDFLVGPLALDFSASGGKFVAYPTVPWAPPLAWLDSSGVVHVDGLAQAVGAGNWGANQVIAKLPDTRLYPGKRRAFISLGANDYPFRCDVWEDGTIRWANSITGVTYTAGNYFSLCGITFRPGA